MDIFSKQSNVHAFIVKAPVSVNVIISDFLSLEQVTWWDALSRSTAGHQARWPQSSLWLCAEKKAKTVQMCESGKNTQHPLPLSTKASKSAAWDPFSCSNFKMAQMNSHTCKRALTVSLSRAVRPPCVTFLRGVKSRECRNSDNAAGESPSFCYLNEQCPPAGSHERFETWWSRPSAGERLIINICLTWNGLKFIYLGVKSLLKQIWYFLGILWYKSWDINTFPIMIN